MRKAKPGRAYPGAGVGLTVRKQEVLQLIASGCHAKEIAERLGVTVHTVEEHIEDIRKQLQARSNAEAVFLGVKHGLLSVERDGPRRLEGVLNRFSLRVGPAG